MQTIPPEREQPAGRGGPFERLAERYDAWFDNARGRRIFGLEAGCIRDLLEETPRPWLEVGVGTGRFAGALHVDEGLDPSPAVLHYAAERGILTRIGRAEAMPFPDKRFGVALLVVTFCFLDNPARALRECRRVLRRDGYAIIGLVPRNSAWGKLYARKGAEGHPFYSVATFYTVREVIALARESGFYLDRATSCLAERPEPERITYRHPQERIVKNAGFVGLRFKIEGR